MGESPTVLGITFDKDGGMLSATNLQGLPPSTRVGAMAEKQLGQKSRILGSMRTGQEIYSRQLAKIQGSWYSFDQNGGMLADKWKESYYLKTSGAMAENEWIFDKTYKSWFYLKADGRYANQEWIGTHTTSKSGGYMAKSEWIYDNSGQSTLLPR